MEEGNNRNVVVVVVYSFTILIRRVGSMLGRCWVDVGSMWSWIENIYNKMRRRRENNKIEGKY